MRFCPSDSWYERKWGHNVSEFRQRFDSELTAGEGPKRLRNLYFLYLIELRALAKVLPFFQQSSFQLYTGRPEEDQRHKEQLLHILQLARWVSDHTDCRAFFLNYSQLQFILILHIIVMLYKLNSFATFVHFCLQMHMHVQSCAMCVN